MAKQRTTNGRRNTSAIQMAPPNSLAIPLQMLVVEFRSELRSLREQVQRSLARRPSSEPSIPEERTGA